MAKKRIVVLYGGPVDEHSISCISAASLLKAIDRERFEPIPVGITRTGAWIAHGTDPRLWELDGECLPEVTVTDQARPVFLNPAQGANGFYLGSHEDFRDNQSKSPRLVVDAQHSTELTPLGPVDAVFPVLHGPYGEDGKVQGLLEVMGLPYVGCGVLASAACMDKHFTKIMLEAAGIPVVPSITVDARTILSEDSQVLIGSKLKELIQDKGLSYPVFVKPSRAGSSFGVTKVVSDNPLELADALAEASRHDWRVLIEEGVDAREIECAVFQPNAGDEPQTAWPGEVVLDEPDKNAFYDFNSKYLNENASHVEVPAKLPQEMLQTIRQIAVRAFTSLDCRGLSRVDMFVLEDESIFVNEINTMPGFTPISMYPKAWEAAGVSYADVITRLLEGILQ